MRKDGGPAFPRAASGDDSVDTGELGMSLRDWFAGQAISASIAELEIGDHKRAQTFAALAYMVADAMLDKRAEKA